MTRPAEHGPLIEFQDGTLVEVMHWPGPSYRVQWVRYRVCNEKRDEDGTHWIKCEVGSETEGPDERGENKFWVRRDYVRPVVLPTVIDGELVPCRQL